jgi:hypothetical protein
MESGGTEVSMGRGSVYLVDHGFEVRRHGTLVVLAVGAIVVGFHGSEMEQDFVVCEEGGLSFDDLWEGLVLVGKTV